ncbi:N-acetyltransferase, partial [Pseudoduganella sp. RAF53_2]
GLGKAIVAHLLEKSRGHNKIILYAVPGKENFYRQFGFRRMTTAMAIFEDQAAAADRGYLAD